MAAQTNWPLLFLLATTLACVSADATSPLGGKTVGGVQSRKDVDVGYGEGKDYRGSTRNPHFEYKYVDKPYDRQYDEKPYQGPTTILLRGVFPEDALNATAGLTPAQHRQTCALTKPSGEFELTPPECAYDFSLTCSHKRSYGSTASYGPDRKDRLLPQSPKPAVIGTGLVAGTLDLLSPPFAAEQILYLDEHRPAHKVGSVYGAMYGFTPAASECNPLLTPSTLIDFGLYQSPPADVYAMFTKIKIPADPAWAWNLWKGLRPAASGLDSGLRRVKAQSLDAGDDGYDTASDGTKYVRGPGYTYVVDQKDDTLCGLTLVVKGLAAIHVPSDRDGLNWVGGVSSVREGFIESPFLWWNGVLKLPGAKSEEVTLPDGTRKPAGRRSRIASDCTGGMGGGQGGDATSGNGGTGNGGNGGNAGIGGTGGAGGVGTGGGSTATGGTGGGGTGGNASGCNTSEKFLDLSTASLIGSEINIGGGGTQAVMFEQTLKYISAMCATADIPFADMGVWTIDLAGA